jgi:crotonobetainyl-CoA:carnitine CoA-transferase CaiB-like acyl-CoA transferase
MWMLSSDVLSALQGQAPRAVSGRMAVNPGVATYRTSDGRHIQLMFLESDRYWRPFCDLIGRPDLVEDERFADHHARGVNAEACIAELDREFALRTYEEWKRVLGGIDAPWAPVQAVEELLEDPQVLANDYIGEVDVEGGPSYRLPRVPVQFDQRPPDLRRAPEHGEHTEAVLLELGYSWDDIVELKGAGVLP